MKCKYIYILFLLLLFFYLGTISSSLKVKELSDFTSYLNEESLTYRDKDGKKLNIIEYNSNLYIPLTSKGLMLDYIVSLKDDSLYLEMSELDSLNIATYSLSSDIFTNDNIYQYDYTFFINWSTWCPDCNLLLHNLNDLRDYLDKRDIKYQIIGLPLDNNLKDVEKYCKNLNFDFKNLIVTKDIEYQLQTNLSFIPNIVIVNSKGKIVDTYAGQNIKEIIETIKELPKCNKC